MCEINRITKTLMKYYPLINLGDGVWIQTDSGYKNTVDENMCRVVEPVMEYKLFILSGKTNIYEEFSNIKQIKEYVEKTIETYDYENRLTFNQLTKIWGEGGAGSELEVI